MATTSLWHIKGRLKDLIDYVENPEKTAAKTPELQDLYNVFSYAALWAGMPPSAIAELISVIRPKCHRSFRICLGAGAPQAPP